MREVQDDGSKATKSTALSWFGMKISDHQIRGTVVNPDSTTFDMIVNEIVSNVELSSLFSTGLPTVLFNEHCTFIVLVDDIVRGHFDTLGFQK
jgi:hypothetical protein